MGCAGEVVYGARTGYRREQRKDGGSDDEAKGKGSRWNARELGLEDLERGDLSGDDFAEDARHFAWVG